MDSKNIRQTELESQFQHFEKLIELDAPAQQQMLVAIGEENPQIRNELERMLSFHLAPASDFLEPTNDSQGSADVLPQGQIIGNYKILQLIDEGGMGQVYMAEQQQGVRRRVALKLIHNQRNSKNFVVRFEAERQALTRLDHPNIARIIDSGQTDTGRSYIVMELVKGDSVIEFCDREKLELKERLKLMESVCRAIHHAHQKGIIHRDIKPSNLLVMLQDGDPTSKVIDFGIAKAFDEPLVAKTLFTKFGEIIGTPDYMSPEQLENGGVDLDIRSDIYSLGVVLHELLTGNLPFERQPNQGLLERLDVLRNSEAVRPSSKVTQAISTNVEKVEEIAAKRRMTSGTLQKYLAGDLDWVILKALAKTRGQRYESAAALASDIRRFLNNEPVEAVAPSWGYKAKKTFQKHRVACLAAGLSSLVLIGATIFSTYWAISSARANGRLEKQSIELQEQVVKSKRLETRAVEAEQQAVELARERQNEAVQARAISKFAIETSGNPATEAAALAVMAKYLPGVLQFKKTELAKANPRRTATATIVLDSRIELKNPIDIPAGPVTLDKLPESIRKVVEARVSQAVGAAAAKIAPVINGEMHLETVSPELRDRQEIHLLNYIKAQQELEFGAEDEFVGQTLLKIARIHGRLNEPLKGQLAVHKAMKILKDEQQQVQCQRLLKELATEPKELATEPKELGAEPK